MASIGLHRACGRALLPRNYYTNRLPARQAGRQANNQLATSILIHERMINIHEISQISGMLWHVSREKISTSKKRLQVACVSLTSENFYYLYTYVSLKLFPIYSTISIICSLTSVSSEYTITKMDLFHL